MHLKCYPLWIILRRIEEAVTQMIFCVLCFGWGTLAEKGSWGVLIRRQRSWCVLYSIFISHWLKAVTQGKHRFLGPSGSYYQQTKWILIVWRQQSGKSMGAGSWGESVHENDEGIQRDGWNTDGICSCLYFCHIDLFMFHINCAPSILQDKVGHNF